MRIASLSPAITEILFQFGVQDLLVCVDHYSDYPEEAMNIPHLQDHQAIAIPDIQAHQSDLIFTSTVVQAKLAQQLQAADLPVQHFDVRSLHDAYQAIRHLGVLLECEQQASALIRSMQEGVNTVKKKAALLPKQLKLYVEEWPGSTLGAATATKEQPAFASANWVPELVRIAGGIQIPQAKTGELSPAISVQDVQDWNPDLVVLSWCGAGTAVDAKQLFMERAGWQDLHAVQEGNVYMIDDSLLNRHGPRMVEGAQRLYGWMFEMLH